MLIEFFYASQCSKKPVIFQHLKELMSTSLEGELVEMLCSFEQNALRSDNVGT